MECNCQRYKARNNEEKQDYLKHLAKISGQIKGIEKMIIEDRYCDDIITQLKAASKSLSSLSMKMLEQHMKTCMKEDILAGKEETIDEVIKLIKRD